jgi:hypothetical protein
MYKNFISAALFLALGAAPAAAQLNMGALQDAHNSVNASRHLPTYLGDHFSTFQISVLNPYVSVGSNFASYQNAKDLLRADRLSSGLIGSTLNDLRTENNSVAGSLDMSIVNAAYNIRDKRGRKLLTLGAGVNERVEVSSSFNQELLQLAAYGNKQFAGQTIDILPRFNGMAFTEYYIAGSLSIAPKYSPLVIRPAIRLSYLSAQAGIQMQRENSLRMFTEADGRYLDFNLAYRVDAALGTDSIRLDGNSFNVNDKSFRGGSGSGFGMDLALRVSPMSGLSFNVGLMDIGSINFRKGMTNMYNTSSYRYEGTAIDFNGNTALNLDSIASLAKPNYSHESFKMNLPTKLIISGSYGLQPQLEKGLTWYRHQLSFLYLQGFDNYLSSTTRPLLSAGYTYSMRNVLNLGVNAGVGGIYGGSIGALASLKLGAFRIGVNSNNLLSLLAPKTGRGADGGVMLALAF